jgi:TfoX/Sxy family transcriptional regulator of competence genes
MAHDETLAHRVRVVLSELRDVDEQRMFGGLTFMVHNKMCITVHEDRLMVRIDPAVQDDALKRKGCHPVVMKGREYKGYVYVDPEGFETEKDFNSWIGLALIFNEKAKASTRRKKE